MVMMEQTLERTNNGLFTLKDSLSKAMIRLTIEIGWKGKTCYCTQINWDYRSKSKSRNNQRVKTEKTFDSSCYSRLDNIFYMLWNSHLFKGISALTYDMTWNGGQKSKHYYRGLSMKDENSTETQMHFDVKNEKSLFKSNMNPNMFIKQEKTKKTYLIQLKMNQDALKRRDPKEENGCTL